MKIMIGHVLCFSLLFAFPFPLDGMVSLAPQEEEPLVHAVRSSRGEEVGRLLGDGAEPIPLALYMAAGLRETSILEMLIEAGGDVNARALIEDSEPMELTPLFGAAMGGNAEMVRVLLEAGADPMATNRFMGMDMTPLSVASMSNRTEVMALLSNAGAQVARSGPATVTSDIGLMRAIEEGDLNGVRAQIEAGMDVNELLLSASTPLSLAAGYPKGELEKQERLVAYLLEAGADVDGRNADGSTAFMSAARRGGTVMMTMLLDEGADPDARDGSGRHAVFYANGYDPATEMVMRASSELRSFLRVPEVRDGGTHPPGALTGPCSKSGAPPSSGMPLAESGITIETSTLIRGPDGSSTAVASPECAPADLRTPGEYEGVTYHCSTAWTVNEHNLRQTTGEGTTLAYLHEETTCSDETFSFSVATETPEPGAPAKCRTATLRLTMPSASEQFVFNDADSASVEIPLQAFAEPEECAEEILWEAPEIEGLEMNILSGPEAGGSGTARLIYWGLPESNDAFGPLTIVATLEGRSVEVEVQLFYDPVATNHPADHPTMSPLGYGGVPSDEVPNWYYYWTQTKAMHEPARGMLYYKPEIEAVNNPTDRVAGRYDFEDEVILISELVFSSGCRGRVNPSTLTSTGARAEGIDCFGEMARHEYQHRVEDVDWWRTGNSNLFYIGGFVRAVRSVLEDSDGDRVPRDVEEAFGWGCTDERRRSCIRLPFSDVTDMEINAYYVGWSQWPLPGPANDQDWSMCGKQWTGGGC